MLSIVVRHNNGIPMVNLSMMSNLTLPSNDIGLLVWGKKWQIGLFGWNSGGNK